MSTNLGSYSPLYEKMVLSASNNVASHLLQIRSFLESLRQDHALWLLTTIYHETDRCRSLYEYNNQSKYGGAGLIMFTGEDNYQALSKCIGTYIDKHTIADSPLIDAMSVVWHIRHNDSFSVANFSEFTRKIVGKRADLKVEVESRVRKVLNLI